MYARHRKAGGTTSIVVADKWRNKLTVETDPCRHLDEAISPLDPVLSYCVEAEHRLKSGTPFVV